MVRVKDFIYMYLHNEINDKCKHVHILSVKQKKRACPYVMFWVRILTQGFNSTLQEKVKAEVLPKVINHLIADKKKQTKKLQQ